jgi:ribosome-associated protein
MHKDNTEDIRVAVLNNLPIELYLVLKIEKIVQSGGEAKYVIAEGLVSVNGEVEKRKRKKIFAGDIISFAEEKIQVVTNEQSSV